ncbi:MAG: hypothetical protein JXR91_06225 [Deltaproteobacteria bacterium]|nr:hypothetical protein [Deltaproteobacteria bacterium]
MAKLVAIGDSLVQGAMSLASSNSKHSFVYMLAKSLGLKDSEFSTPDFDVMGGIPVNLEWLSRKLERRFGAHISLWEWPAVGVYTASLLEKIENYWEKGSGSLPLSNDILYNNLGVFGFQVADSYDINSDYCKKMIEGSRDDFFQPPSFGWLRLARSVLNPAFKSSRKSDTQLDVVQKIKDRDGRIENLLLCTGANNCLNTVFKLFIKQAYETSPGPDSSFTLWSSELFKAEYLKVADKIDAIDCENVYVCTVPPVLAMPLAKGLMDDGTRGPGHNDFFDYYVKPWVSKEHFNPLKDRYITGLEAKEIDEIINRYNLAIKEIAVDRGYTVIDFHKVVDSAWYDKYRGDPPIVLPDAIKDLDGRFLNVNDEGAIVEGGLFSLDGMHPTLCGYGLLAQECIDSFRLNGQDVEDIDFYELRKRDSLVSDPPLSVNDIMNLLKFLEEHFHLSRWMRVSIDTGIGTI